jgi:hypothetical protein
MPEPLQPMPGSHPVFAMKDNPKIEENQDYFWWPRNKLVKAPSAILNVLRYRKVQIPPYLSLINKGRVGDF